MPNGRHWCAYCGTMIIEYDAPCPRCLVPAEVVEGKRELTADEILQRTLTEEERRDGSI